MRIPGYSAKVIRLGSSETIKSTLAARIQASTRSSLWSFRITGAIGAGMTSSWSQSLTPRQHGLAEIPRDRPEPPEQGRSVLELAGDEMGNLALALHLARHMYKTLERPFSMEGKVQLHMWTVKGARWRSRIRRISGS